MIATQERTVRRDALTKSHAELIKVLERCQSMPLLMKTWDKTSRDAAYDEIQAALIEARKLGR